MRLENDDPALDVFRPELYEISRIERETLRDEYLAFLEAHYEPLGFFCEEVLPSATSSLYSMRFRGELAAIFRLTEVTSPSSPYFSLVPGAVAETGDRRRLLEVNNVVIARPFRASAVLGLILYRSACEAHAAGFDFVVGLNRYQILRFFVDFGVVPVDQPPVHVLGQEHLCDFVNYYDTADTASIAYMHERAKRYFHQEYVMRSIKSKYVRNEATRRRLHGATPGVPHSMPSTAAAGA